MKAIDVDTALGWRGMTVTDRDGEKLGRLEAVYLDEAERPGWGAVHTGLFGLRRTFVPLYVAEEGEDCIRVPYTREHVKGAPAADPDVQLSADEEERLLRHYAMTHSGEEHDGAGRHRVPHERVRITNVLAPERREHA